MRLFKRKKKAEPPQLDKWAALDRLTRAMAAINREQYGAACRILEMDAELFEGDDLETVALAMNVRLADLARKAGLPIDKESK